MVAVDDDQGIVAQAQLFDAGEDALNAGVHIGDGTVVLGVHIVAVAHPGRHPIGEEVAEGLEAKHRLHALVFGVEFVAAVKHPLKGGRRQIGGVWVHVAQEQEEGFLRAREPFQLGDGDLVEVFGLGAAAFGKGTPTRIVQIAAEAARTGVAREPNARGVVAAAAEDLG